MSDLGADCEGDHSAAGSGELSVAQHQRADHPRWLIQRRTVMTENVMTAKNEVPSVRDELSSEELEAVSGGSFVDMLNAFVANLTDNFQKQQENAEQPLATKTFAQALQQAGSV
jgi:hypothetical protein